MMEKIAKIFFYFMKTFNFPKLLLADDKKAFLKTTKTVENLAFAFSQKMKIDKNNSF